MRKTTKTRITAFVAEGLAKRFNELTRQSGISGTALLSRTLPGELDYLEKVEANSERASRFLRRYEDALSDPGDVPARFNITLERRDAKRMNEVCQGKGIPRDAFLRMYVAFLVNGEEGVCESPLQKAGKLIANPRYEYEEARKGGPATLLNMDDDSYEVRGSVPNPYSSLHQDDTTLDLMRKAITKPEGRQGNGAPEIK